MVWLGLPFGKLGEDFASFREFRLIELLFRLFLDEDLLPAHPLRLLLVEELSPLFLFAIVMDEGDSTVHNVKELIARVLFFLNYFDSVYPLNLLIKLVLLVL